MSSFSYAAKAFIKNHNFFAQYMAMHQQLNLGYIIPIRKNFSFVSHYKYDATMQKSTTTIGLKQKYQQTEILATLNSRLKLITNFVIKGPSYGIRLCAQADYEKQDYAFGYGVTIGMME
jgi:mitochondrial import receptor subunit TOM40